MGFLSHDCRPGARPLRDSDVDLRGVRLLPVADLVGLREPDEARTRMWDHEGVEMDLVTHDLRKFVRLMLRHNGYVLEQLLSPLVAHTAEAEHGGADVDRGRVAADVERLHGVLDQAQADSGLPGGHSASDALHDLVVRVRLQS
ncbi:hypothetical protein E5671_13450 [Streptomyces sp. BA2]|nr:hypothetical protein [Streptomyces sp. BA2]